jgi:hypothetical protein
MPKALRIDDVRPTADGFAIEYTQGNAPLPAAKDGAAYLVNTIQDIKDRLDQIDRDATFDILFNVLLARFRAIDPDMDTAALIRGRVATFDPSTNNVIVVV